MHFVVAHTCFPLVVLDDSIRDSSMWRRDYFMGRVGFTPHTQKVHGIWANRLNEFGDVLEIN